MGYPANGVVRGRNQGMIVTLVLLLLAFGAFAG
jgi:hypothetical protein